MNATKKTTAKTVKKKTTTKKTAAKTVKKAVVTGKTSAKKANTLHYNKEKVIADYNATFTLSMKIAAVCLAGIVLYFFVFATYLGGTSHEKHNPFLDKFGDRIDLSTSYDGLKLPAYKEEE